MKNKKNVFKIILLAILGITQLGAIKISIGEENTQSVDYYYLKVETHDAIATVYLNGAPLVKSPDNDGLITIEPINQWLFEKENKLSYQIHGTDESNTEHTPDIKAEVFLHNADFEVPTAGKVLASLAYKHNNKSQYPHSETVTFNFDQLTLTNLWKETTPVTSISESDKADIIKLANSFVSSIINSKYEDAISIQKYKIQEDALAEGKTYARLEEVTRKTYDWVGTQGPLVSQPFKPDQLDFVLCCNNRLIYLVRKNNEEAIIIESDELYLNIATYYAKIKGQWTIVR